MASDRDEEQERKSQEEGERKRDVVAAKTKDMAEFLKKNLVKGEMALKRAAGLGHQPNVVPVTEPRMDGEARAVEVGWHPVGGFAGKWFAEETGLGKMITEKINKYPDPTQHWAVLVGDYAHQLWMDENFHVIYTNEKVNREEWRTFKVGETTFNDDATRRAGESVIQSIRDATPAYNLISNNCQTYALQLLDAIKVGASKEFGTTLAVYDRLFGPGAVKDLFIHQEEPQAIEDGRPPPKRTDTVSFAQQVMDENTHQLDTKEEMDKHDKERQRGGVEEDGDDEDEGDSNGSGGEKKKKKKSIFSRFLRK